MISTSILNIRAQLIERLSVGFLSLKTFQWKVFFLSKQVNHVAKNWRILESPRTLSRKLENVHKWDERVEWNHFPVFFTLFQFQNWTDSNEESSFQVSKHKLVKKVYPSRFH